MNGDFHANANAALKELEQMLEQADFGDNIDIELVTGILEIELDDGRKYVINKHEPSGQIWVASPVSGAHHMRFEDGHWKAGGYELKTLVMGEIGNIFRE